MSRRMFQQSEHCHCLLMPSMVLGLFGTAGCSADDGGFDAQNRIEQRPGRTATIQTVKNRAANPVVKTNGETRTVKNQAAKPDGEASRRRERLAGTCAGDPDPGENGTGEDLGGRVVSRHDDDADGSGDHFRRRQHHSSLCVCRRPSSPEPAASVQSSARVDWTDQQTVGFLQGNSTGALSLQILIILRPRI